MNIKIRRNWGFRDGPEILFPVAIIAVILGLIVLPAIQQFRQSRDRILEGMQRIPQTNSPTDANSPSISNGLSINTNTIK